MLTLEPAFAPPSTPAARCLHVMRHQQLTTRRDLIDATGLSQPTVTRAVSTLIDHGLVQQRTDLTRSTGRGRPTVPLEVVDMDWVHAGFAVGTHSTYLGLFDTRGRTLRSRSIDLPIAEMSPDDVVEHLIAALHRTSIGLDRPLRTVGITFPGRVDSGDVISAPSIGWHDVDVAARLRYQFSVPVTIAAAVPAILGAELQSRQLNEHSLALFADDSVGAAVTAPSGVRPLPVSLADDSILPTAGLLKGTGFRTFGELVADESADSRSLLDARARGLAELLTGLVEEHSPELVVVAGSAFIDDPQAPSRFARAVREHTDVPLRLIPTHDEVVRAIARAAALDHMIHDPIAFA
ncbi:ROK family transcriptional regulator [Corynebacterium tapiri]|uniref:ROK family transcriptional regulator n=1 Tax=Corynebacterium tapiri TaxID=1448266 RepID=A0A5C4U2H9_9CORY|nr:ROK family transcriptional regulator [Corynebacterium tapiri]TNL96791.1 ROK family transcriptional regulator [Corynebacterium tapiri]